jgi:hypothetical protein
VKIRERVMRARQKQLQRFASSREKIYCNAQMSSRHIRAFCELSADCERLLERAMTQQGLSARAHDRILKVARTIADLEDSAHLEPKHIAEAIQYRSLDRTWLRDTVESRPSLRFYPYCEKATTNPRILVPPLIAFEWFAAPTQIPA